jgi:hypothetical protein
MKLSKATFRFDAATVVFVDGACGPRVEVWRGGKRVHSIDNADRRYKPCVTHCLDVLRMVEQKPPKNEFARQRQKAARPAVGIAKGT